MSPGLRKLALTVHVTTSVGWFGAVLAFEVLAIAGLTTASSAMLRSAYLSMELVGWLVIVPLCALSLMTGVVQALGTKWGLLRHYWVLIKFLMTVVSTAILLVHMRPIGYVANLAGSGSLSFGDVRDIRLQLTADAGAALVALLVAATLSVYKPPGLTPLAARDDA